MIGRRIEDKGYISHDTSKDYNLGRGTLFVTDSETGKLKEVGMTTAMKLTLGPKEID